MCALEIRPAIGTERLILRAPTLADTAVIAELANDTAIAGMLTSWPYPFTDGPFTENDAQAWLVKVTSADPRRRSDFIIEHRQFGVIGVIGVGEDEPCGAPAGLHGPRPRLGYWLGRPFWNRGYATEAVAAVLRWVAGEGRRNVVWAGHFADNRASGQVLVKAGFLYTGDVEMTPSPGRAGATVPNRMMVWLA